MSCFICCNVLVGKGFEAPPRDILQSILMILNPKSLSSACAVNTIYRDFCKDDIFKASYVRKWYNEIVEYGEMVLPEPKRLLDPRLVAFTTKWTKALKIVPEDTINYVEKVGPFLAKFRDMIGSILWMQSLSSRRRWLFRDAIILLLNAGANPNSQDKDGYTALMVASRFKQVDTVRMLLGAGANPNLQQKGGLTALMSAIGSSKRALKRARHDYTGVDIIIVSMLLDAGANPNLQGKHTGWTALIEASQNGHEEIVRLLLDAGANTEFRGITIRKRLDGKTDTAIDFASKAGYKNIVHMLKEAGAK